MKKLIIIIILKLQLVKIVIYYISLLKFNYIIRYFYIIFIFYLDIKKMVENTLVEKKNETAISVNFQI